MKRAGNDVFVSITNKQIYEELKQFKEENRLQHEAIIEELTKYKSQVANLKMAITGIGILAMATLGWLVVYISK